MPRKKLKNPVTLFYPNQLLVNDLMSDVIKDYPFAVKQRDYFLLFHILAKPYFALEQTNDSSLQIHSDIIQDVLGRSYSAIIKALVKCEYIVVNEYASEYLGICKSYAIHPRLVDVAKPFNTVNIEYDNVLHNKINRIGSLNLTKVDTTVEVSEGREHVIEMTNQLMLVPDAVALAYVKEQYDSTGNVNSPESFFHYWNYNPLKGAGVDKFGKRVHSVITNLPKKLRRCLRFKDDVSTPVVEIDIVNSQPFFLSVINSNLINEYVPECSSAIAIYERYSKNLDYIKFCEIATNGTFYEEFEKLYVEMYGRSYGSTPNQARLITKKLTYGVFFSDYEYKIKGLYTASKTEESQLNKDFFKVFQFNFPSVFQIFRELKALDWSFTQSKSGVRKQYANNCLLAQRLESAIIFDCVIPDLITYDINAATIHDCVLVKETDKQATIGIMNETFKKIKINPQIK